VKKKHVSNGRAKMARPNDRAAISQCKGTPRGEKTGSESYRVCGVGNNVKKRYLRGIGEYVYGRGLEVWVSQGTSRGQAHAVGSP